MFRGKQGFPWIIGPETRKGTTMWYWYLLVSVLSLFIGIGVTAYLKRDNRGFEILMKGLHVIAFYRCFGKWSEAAVRHELSVRKKALQDSFGHRDMTRVALARSISVGCSPENRACLEKILSRKEGEIVKCQLGYDYAVGLAFLSGFGKITSEVLAEKLAAA